MKVLFMCHGAGNGGAERIITTLANEFSKREYVVTLLTTKNENNTYPLQRDIKHIIINIEGSNVIARTIKRVIQIRRVLKKEKPECIVSFSAVPNMQVIVANFGLKTPVIISERTDPSRYPESAIGKILRDYLYKKSDSIVFQTKDAMNYFKNKTIQKKGKIIINPIRNDLPQRFCGERDKRVVGIGALVPQKNWLIGLEAFRLFAREFPEYYFEIYGEGSERDIIERFIQSDDILKTHVILKGFDLDAVNKINSASIFISSSDYEGISNSMLEALATGVPTVCTDCPVGGAKMVIKSGINGMLAPVGDSKRLSECMCKIASDRAFSERISINATLLRKELSTERIVDEWCEEVKKLCSR